MSKSTPALTVILAAYNSEKYLSKAIDSILSQNFTDLEFIIVNDGSTDSTGEICAKYAALDSRVEVIENAKNLGLTRSLNKSLYQAKGEYVARMDADDVSHSKRLETQFQYLEEHPDIGLVGTFYQQLDKDGNIQDVIIRFPVQPMVIKWHLTFENPIPHPPIMMRKELIDRVGGYDERWETSQDYDLFTKLSRITKMKNLPEVLFYWRVHDQSVSSQRNIEQRQNALLIGQKFVSELLGKPMSMNVIQALWNRQQGGAEEAIIISETLLKLAQKILEERVWSSNERREFRHYAANKIFNHLRPHAPNKQMWKSMGNLFLFYPPFFVERIASKI